MLVRTLFRLDIRTLCRLGGVAAFIEYQCVSFVASMVLFVDDVRRSVRLGYRVSTGQIANSSMPWKTYARLGYGSFEINDMFLG